MLPKIKSVKPGKIHINDDIVENDFFLHANGMENVDRTSRITKKDFDRMLLHDPEIAIFGTGFRGRLQVGQDVLDAAKKSKVDVHILKTPEALEKFKELARKGGKVVAHINVGE